MVQQKSRFNCKVVGSVLTVTRSVPFVGSWRRLGLAFLFHSMIDRSTRKVSQHLGILCYLYQGGTAAPSGSGKGKDNAKEGFSDSNATSCLDKGHRTRDCDHSIDCIYQRSGKPALQFYQQRSSCLEDDRSIDARKASTARRKNIR
jgi:hypothetical protein